jgi:hypothetical protein
VVSRILLKLWPGLQVVLLVFLDRHGTPDLVLLDLKRNQGELAMWYIVLSRSLPDKEEDKQLNAEEHRLWLEEQHRSGRLLFSGPTADRA